MVSYLDLDANDLNRQQHRAGPGPQLMGANTLIGDHVHNRNNEQLGILHDILLDMHSGKIVYAVLSSGGVLAVAAKLFAVPWQALSLDLLRHSIMLDIDKKTMENAPGFDADAWPDMANAQWASQIQRYYNSSAHKGRQPT